MALMANISNQELERQYSPSLWSHRMDKDAVIEAHVKETTEGTRLSRTLVQTELNIPYGQSESETFDLYLPQYLISYGCSKEESGFMVSPLVSRGIAVMVMDYDIAPKGNMDLMVSQVRRSIAATLTRYPHDIYLCGHSAGAHLAAMMLCTDWGDVVIRPNIKGAVLVSGIYDLLPIIHTYVNDALGMSPEVAARNSPMLFVADVARNAGACKIAVVAAEHDSPEFKRQSKDYFQGVGPLLSAPSGSIPRVTTSIFLISSHYFLSTCVLVRREKSAE
uniref:Arylformamidase n=1 Tax=Leptobrachium leishanense TaxID=445787 RepID=A0A8C5R338_9ANUR